MNQIMAFNTENILKSSGISITQTRIKVLQFLLEENRVIALKEIESALGNFDRITLYRTLKTFVAKGIIHKVSDGTNSPKYAICQDQCDEHKHQDNHAHFHCGNCEQTYCLEEVPIPNIPNLPKGYQIGDTILSFLVYAVAVIKSETAQNFLPMF